MEKPGQFEVALASEMRYSDIKENNIIFFGKYNTLGIFNEFVRNKYFSLDYNNNGNAVISFSCRDSLYKAEIAIRPDNKTDFTVVVKLKMAADKYMLMVIAMDDPGEMATLNYMLDIKNLEYLETQLKLTAENNSFKAFFKVVGLERTDMSIEFIGGERL